MPKVLFTSPLEEVAVEVAPGTTLLEAALRSGARLGHSCGGICSCATCHVWIRQGLDSLPPQSPQEVERLTSAFDVRPSSRLSCQTEVGSSDLVVEVTEESLSAWMDEHPAERRRLEAAGKWPLGTTR